MRVTELEFDSIKENFRQFLEDNGYFQDYDFEGSGLSAIMDLLAYNTHYMAMYGNMLGSEMFLDSATSRSAVVSRAKELGYLPGSYTAPRARLRVRFVPEGSPNPAIIDSGTRFTTTVDGTSYTFITAQEYSVTPVLGVYQTDIDIYQGSVVEYQYTVDTSDSSQRFLLLNKNTDLSFLRVFVKSDVSATAETEWSRTDNFISDDVDATSTVFWVEETYDGFYELKFGNDVIGQALESGNIVRISTLVTEGATLNGAKTFRAVGTIAGTSDVTITTISGSSNGSSKESIESIRAFAPKFYQSQNRAVTASDYISILKNKYPYIQDVVVWGGEDELPYPEYGKIFVSIKPISGVYLTQRVKDDIVADLRENHGVITTTAEIVDPDYTYVNVSCALRYDGTKTTDLPAALTQSAIDAITDYFADNINEFGRDLYVSKMSSEVDDAHSSFVGNIIEVEMEKRFIPSLTQSVTHYIYFTNSISPGSLVSSEFSISGTTYRLYDVPTGTAPYTTGTLKIANDTTTLSTTAGTINYVTGDVVITEFQPSAFSGGYVSVNASALPNAFEVALTEEDVAIRVNGRNQMLQLLDTPTVTITKE